jgi:hypothetical protein
MNGLAREVASVRCRAWRSTLVAAAIVVGMPLAHAADALNGKGLYLNGPVGGGASCASCHTASPASNVNNITAAANNPGVITRAIANNAGGMGSLFKGRFTSAELADLAAFIGNPNVTAAPAAAVNPGSLGFPGTTIGQSAGVLATTLTNTGNAALNITTLSLAGAAAGDYVISGGSCANGGTVGAGASCTVQVGFRPSASGTRNATLSIAHNATGGSSTVALSGIGNAVQQPTIALSASALDFGALISGVASPAQSITVSNTGQAALTLSSIGVGGANPSAFTLGGSCSTAAPVAAGAGCTVTVTASSSASGAFSGSLTLASNAANGAVTVALSGSVSAPAPALAATPSAVAFGARTIGSAAALQDITLANTGNVALTLNGVSVSGAAGVTIAAKTCGATLAVAASCTVTLAFAPTTEGAAAATLAIRSNAAPLQVGISGSGTAAPVARPVLSEGGPLAFPDTQVGKISATHTVTLGNSGSAALKVVSLVLNGAQAGDFVLDGTCVANASVSAAASCTMDISFKPTGAGKRVASAVLMTDAGAQFTVALGGTGVDVPVPVPVQRLTANPQAVDFGTADVNGAAATHHITVTNAGAAPATLTGATFTGPFALQADGGSCAAFPFTLAPGAGCDLAVRFAPAAAGSANGSIALAADGGPPLTVALSGNGNVPAVVPAPSGQPEPAQQVPQNAGGGGCSAVTDGNDPMLAFLVVLSAGVLLWRRCLRKLEPRS